MSPSDSSESNSHSLHLPPIVLSRHTTRAFDQTRPVPQSILEECLTLAQNSPSSSNQQPWRLYFATGASIERLRSGLLEAYDAKLPSTTPAIPEPFRHYRSEVGHSLYGPDGYNIPRDDKDGMRLARRRGYELFGAPTVAVICIPSAWAEKGYSADVMSVGLYVQTLVLLLTERGLGTCLQVLPAGHPDVIKKALRIEDDVEIICTLAVGWEDESKPVNTVRVKRDSWKESVKFVD